MPSTAKQSHPFVAYLRRHEWEWVPESVVLNESRCTQDDIRVFCERPWFRCIIEEKNGEYRYISNNLSYKRRLVETLKNAYPDWLTSSELQRRADCENTPDRLIATYSDLLPIEREEFYDPYRKRNIYRYRYIPGDPRSLIEYTPCRSLLAENRAKKQDEVFVFLQNHSGEWFTSAEIKNHTTLSSSDEVAQALRQIRSRNTLVKCSLLNNDRPFIYSYNPASEGVII